MAKVLIETAGTEFEQNMADLAMIDDSFREGRPTMINSADLDEAFTNASQDVKNKISFDVNGEERTVIPTTSQQVLTPSTGKNAMTKVTVNAVTSAIDSNITAENIKKDVSILGVTGTLSGEPEIIPVTMDGSSSTTNLYKTLYLKDGSWTIPYSEELVSEIEAALAAGDAKSDILMNNDESGDPGDGRVVGKIRQGDFSQNLCLSVEVYDEDNDQSLAVAAYTFTINVGESIAIMREPNFEVSPIKSFSYDDGLLISGNSDSYPAIAALLFYSTTDDVITPTVGE